MSEHADPRLDETVRPIELIDLPDALAPEYLRTQKVVPVARSNGTVTVVAPYDADPDVMDDLRVAFQVPQVIWMRAEPSEVEAAIERALVGRAETVSDLVDQLAVSGDGVTAAPATTEDLTSLANQPPVVKLVNLVLLEALEARASDVHLEGHGPPGFPSSCSSSSRSCSPRRLWPSGCLGRCLPGRAITPQARRSWPGSWPSDWARWA